MLHDQSVVLLASPESMKSLVNVDVDADVQLLRFERDLMTAYDPLTRVVQMQDGNPRFAE